MSVVNTVTIDSVDYTILPGTFRFENRPDTVVRHNEPCVVIGANYQCEFEMDEDNIASLVSSGQGPGNSTVEISGFPTIYNATINIAKLGPGIQKSRVICTGTKET